jgi:type IV secretory pathway VirB10-like protein
MKLNIVILAGGCLALSAASLVAQSALRLPADSPEIEYLRRLIAEQQKNPNKIIRSLPPANPKTTNTPSPAPVVAKPSPAPAKPPVAPAATPPAASPLAPAPQQQQVSEVESRLDTLMRQKAEREKAALTNAATATNSLPATPQTKRQRLDALLKQLIDGQISGVEYNERRNRIIAEPD